MRSRLAACALMALAATPCGAQEGVSTAAGVFTEAQAKAGEQAYQTHCSGCHGFDLRKTDAEAPDLTDSPFRFGWNGKTVAERFEKMRTTMPKSTPRSLDDQTYLDIIAYILSFNGIPAGERKLAPEMAALERITIEVPAASPASGRRRR